MANILSRSELIYLLLLSPTILLADYFWEFWLQPWLALLLFVPLFIRLLSTRRLSPPSLLTLPILLFLAWSVLMTFLATDTTLAIPALNNLAVGVALYFACVNSPDLQKTPHWLAVILGLAGLALAILGPALMENLPTKLLTFDSEISTSRPLNLFGTGETINTNVLAAFLLLPIPLLSALGLRWQWSKWLWLLILPVANVVLMIMTLILSQSRGGILAISLSLLIVFTLRWRLTLLIAAIILLAVGSVSSWDNLLLFAEALGSDGSISSLSGRWEIWIASWYALLNYPAFGIGLGAYPVMMPKLFPNVIPLQGIPHAHNLWLQVGLDLGIPGLLLYLALWITAIFMLGKVMRRHPLPRQAFQWDVSTDSEGAPARRVSRRARRSALKWSLAVGVIGSISAMWLHGVVEAVTWNTKLAFLPWLLLALTTLLYTHVQPSTSKDG